MIVIAWGGVSDPRSLGATERGESWVETSRQQGQTIL